MTCTGSGSHAYRFGMITDRIAWNGMLSLIRRMSERLFEKSGIMAQLPQARLEVRAHVEKGG